MRLDRARRYKIAATDAYDAMTAALLGADASLNREGAQTLLTAAMSAAAYPLPALPPNRHAPTALRRGATLGARRPPISRATHRAAHHGRSRRTATNVNHQRAR